MTRGSTRPLEWAHVEIDLHVIHRVWDTDRGSIEKTRLRAFEVPLRTKGTAFAEEVLAMRTNELLWTSLAILTLGAGMAIGCSSEQPPLAEEEEEEEPTLPKSNSSSSSSSSGGETTPPADYDAGAYDPDASLVMPLADAGPADPSLCAGDSVPESESNDSAALANLMPGQTGSFCGTIGSAVDVDHSTFTLPANVRSMGYGVVFSRPGVDATLSVNGQVFRLNQLIPVIPNGKYTLRVTGPQGLSYRFKLAVGL